MAAGVWYGLLIGVLAGTLTSLWPGRLGWAVWWGLLTLHLAMGAVVTWRRTRLFPSTLSLALGSVFGLAVVVLAAGGLGWPDLAANHWAVIVPLLLAGPLLSLVESRRHPEYWRRWRLHMQSCSLLDILAMRHIPEWRGSAQSGDRHGM